MHKLLIACKAGTLIVFTVVFLCSPTYSQGKTSISGIVKDLTGAPAASTPVSLLNSQQVVLASVQTDGEGRYVFSQVVPGSYEVNVAGNGFLQARKAVAVSEGQASVCDLTLEVNPFTELVTVTADVGQVQDKDELGQQVNIIGAEKIRQRAGEVVAQVANEEVGAALQRTSPTVGGIFIRGLTGKNVVVFVDGIRYSNSAQRGGINTFLNMIEPSSLKGVELLRGPNSSQYGSDSLGGSIQVVTQPVVFSPNGPRFSGQTSLFGNTASAGFGQATKLAFGGERYGFLVNLASRRINTLRPADGIDSHAAVTRFLGIPSNIINGDRLPDTAFTEYGGSFRFNYSSASGNQLIFSYQRGQQDGGKRYDQLLGGDGNLIADLKTLRLDFGYVRFDSRNVPGFDNVMASFSFNNQREERINQGGNGNPLGSITHQPERTRTYGVQLYGNKQLGDHNLLVGADYYHDRLESVAYTFSPVSKKETLSRPRIPHNARYNNHGFYAQDVWNAIRERLKLSGSVRYGAASYAARSSDSPLVNGKPLFPSDSLRADQVTFRVGAVVNLNKYFYVTANFSRGFRAPHMTDLGTLGLTGDGFEVAAPDLAGLGATIGDTANSRAVSTGRPVVQVKPEISKNYETALHFRNDRIDTDLGVFLTDIDDNLTKQTLILPQGAVGKFLGGERITAQLQTGAVLVAAASNPVLVRSNFDDARLFGIEYTLDAEVAPKWNVGGNFTYIRAKDKRTGLAPNIEGGTPAPNGNLRVRYNPPGKRYWAELFVNAAYRQDRLSSLDLSDRRTGATRSRTQIRNFFLNGATVRGLVAAGPDGKFGTADDTLTATGETVTQIQNRLLGSADDAPLFRGVPGYYTLGVRGAYRFNDNHELFFALENITDKSHRGISWGIDGPGVNLTLRYTVRF